MTDHMRLDDVFDTYSDGDETGWANEFAWIRHEHAARIRGLTLSILQLGIQNPILLGNDGRVWDGHHRLYVAHSMGFETVPVEHARPTKRRYQ